MERTLHTSNRLEITSSLLPGLGFALAYERKYRELALILGCFLITFEFKRTRNKKRK
jgi:hypothetical protein